jgi:hypothetical protein
MKKKKLSISVLQKKLHTKSNWLVAAAILLASVVIFAGLCVQSQISKSVPVRSASLSLENTTLFKSPLLLAVGLDPKWDIADDDVTSVDMLIGEVVYPCEGVQLVRSKERVQVVCTVTSPGKKFTTFSYRAKNKAGAVTFQGRVKGGDPRKVSLVVVQTGKEKGSVLYFSVKSQYLFNHCSLVSASSMAVVGQSQGRLISNPLLPLESARNLEDDDVFARCYIGSSYVDTDSVAVNSLL